MASLSLAKPATMLVLRITEIHLRTRNSESASWLIMGIVLIAHSIHDGAS